MKVIDILNKIANGKEIPKFYIDDDRYTFYYEKSFLKRYKNNEREYTDDYCEWNIYPEWLNREITIINEDI